MNEQAMPAESGSPLDGYEQVGGDPMMKTASTSAKKAVLAGRALLYANKAEALKRAITGANRLVEGAAPILAILIDAVQERQGELSLEDLTMVAMHLAGTVVEVARNEGDPEAMDQDGARAVKNLTRAVVELLASGDAAPESEAQVAPEGEPPILESAGGLNG